MRCHGQEAKMATMLRSIFVCLIITALPTAGATTAEEYLSDPNRFFAESEPTLTHDGSAYHLTLTTPLPVLCAVHHGLRDPPAAGAPTGYEVATMDMSSPAEVHDVILPFEGLGSNVTRHVVFLTAFLPAGYRSVLQSPPYDAVADPASPRLSPASDSGSAAALDPASDISACPFELTAEAKDTTAALVLSSPPPRPTVHSVAFSSADSAAAGVDGEVPIYLARTGSSGPQTDPAPFLAGLAPGAEYSAVACFVDTLGEVCCSPPYEAGTVSVITFVTEAADDGFGGGDGGDGGDCLGPNVALLSLGASVLSASSIWGGGSPDSSFGSNRAIDGRPMTEWSSAGDGDGASLSVGLASPVRVAGVGVDSRAMTGSAEILSFGIALSRSGGDASVATTAGGNGSDGGGSGGASGRYPPLRLGPYDLESTLELHRFDLRKDMGKRRDEYFDVVTFNVVTSTGGNTGLRSLEVYPLMEECVSSEVDGGGNGDGGDDGAAGEEEEEKEEDVTPMDPPSPTISPSNSGAPPIGRKKWDNALMIVWPLLGLIVGSGLLLV